MTGWSATLGFQIGEIIWIDLLLSGDNAVLIALACRRLPGRQRRWGMTLGAAGAVLLRIGFTLVVGQIFATPLLKTVGGVLLLAIAIKLLVEETEHKEVAASERLWSAVFSIVAADAVMSLDNV
ncbi:MAG: TerC family protein, partial [Methylocystis sp.]|nr:TerC family protein [Methylocystis sp.]